MAGFTELLAYQKAFKVAMEIFETSKTFPKEEKYSLTDQIRRSSRSVCSNLAEGFRKKLYKKHFIAKISDADMENAETLSWLYFASACKYISDSELRHLKAKNEEIGKLLGFMLANPDKYL